MNSGARNELIILIVIALLLGLISFLRLLCPRIVGTEMVIKGERHPIQQNPVNHPMHPSEFR